MQDVLAPVMGKILFKSILSTSTSTQPKKYLKYKYKYIISKVFKIQVQNTAPPNVFWVQVQVPNQKST